MEITAGLLRGRFTAPILWRLFWGGKSFYQLLRETEGLSPKVLAHELEEMERTGLIARRVHPRGPARVEYALTALGESLKPVVGVMYEWGLKALGSAMSELDVWKQAGRREDEHASGRH